MSYLYITLCIGIIYCVDFYYFLFDCFFFQAEDGIRDAQESRGLGDVYKRQSVNRMPCSATCFSKADSRCLKEARSLRNQMERTPCLLYTSDAADDLLCVDLGGRRIIKKKKHIITQAEYKPLRTIHYHD